MWATSTITTDSPKLPRQIIARQKLKQRLGNEAADLPECHDEFGLVFNNPAFSFSSLMIFWSASKNISCIVEVHVFWDEVVPKVQVGEHIYVCERYNYTYQKITLTKNGNSWDFCRQSSNALWYIPQLTSTSWENQLGNPPIHIFS